MQDALKAIAALPENQRAQGWLDQLRTILATEIEAMAPIGLINGQPGSSLLFPADEPSDVLLAQLTGITLTPAAGGTRTASVTTIDTGVRWTHVPTATIVELLAALGAASQAGGTVTDAGGPRIDPSTAAWNGDSIVVTASGTFLTGTLAVGTAVTSIDPAAAAGGWTQVSYTPSFDAGTHAPVRAQSAAAVRRVGPGADPGNGRVAGDGRARIGHRTAGGLRGRRRRTAVGTAEGTDVAFLIERS